ncbi:MULTISPECIES: hypothetical protein [Cyanophyceae]|uniref:hypothetical protein n=1 Tax=Cyanophyceae TaxID=3028117 RepID=UPI001685425A|nr:hypothetical protein [Trichocoleus sp. FACHB-40]MBD2006359.1 hypothetical protein [Trichocoleus sp. FACHB-40]
MSPAEIIAYLHKLKDIKEQPDDGSRLVSELQSNPRPVPLNPDHPVLLEATKYLGWMLCKPLPPQWDYWHCITDEGGVVPIILEGLLRAMEAKHTPEKN